MCDYNFYILSLEHEKYNNVIQNLPEPIVQNTEQYQVELIFNDLLLWTVG